jgi:drug/metabolite transporter (DMT)-like permease
MTLAIPAHTRSENIRGILAMLVSMATFVVNDTLVKVAAGSLPTGQAIFVRGVFTVALCVCLIYATGAAWALPHALSPRLLLRGLADVGGTVFFLSALVRMPMGDVFGILQFTPLAITAAAALFLGARVGWRRWSATCAGLLGVLVIVRPGGSAFTPYAVLVMISVMFSVARDLLTRGVGTGVPSLVIAGASATIVTLSSLAFMLLETWIWPSTTTIAILAVASIALLAGQYCLIAAMRTGEIAVVAPFRYSIILWAVLSGYLVWREVPDALTWLGIAIVAGAGLYTFLREQHLGRMART